LTLGISTVTTYILESDMAKTEQHTTFTEVLLDLLLVLLLVPRIRSSYDLVETSMEFIDSWSITWWWYI
jgi:hypothetical protein